MKKKKGIADSILRVLREMAQMQLPATLSNISNVLPQFTRRQISNNLYSLKRNDKVVGEKQGKTVVWGIKPLKPILVFPRVTGGCPNYPDNDTPAAPSSGFTCVVCGGEFTYSMIGESIMQWMDERLQEAWNKEAEAIAAAKSATEHFNQIMTEKIDVEERLRRVQEKYNLQQSERTFKF